jgi:hypothetical protein
MSPYVGAHGIWMRRLCSLPWHIHVFSNDVDDGLKDKSYEFVLVDYLRCVEKDLIMFGWAAVY